MATPASTSELAQFAHAREESAATLEAAIVALGVAYQDYLRDTQALTEHAGENLQSRLEIPITLHLVRAGLAPFLERKLQIAGRLASLRSLVEKHHEAIDSFNTEKETKCS